jgi:hypothetical protein
MMIRHGTTLALFMLMIAMFGRSTAAVGMNIEVQGNAVVMSGDVTGGECSQLQSILQQTQLPPSS